MTERLTCAKRQPPIESKGELGNHMIPQTTVTNNKAGEHKPRPSLAEEARDLYQLAESLGDSATMAIAMRDFECAMELERDPATMLLEPLPEGQHGIPGCRLTTEERHRIACQPVSPRFGHRLPQPYELLGTISVQQYAERHGLTDNQVYHRIYTNQIPAIQTGHGYENRWRIRDEEVA